MTVAGGTTDPGAGGRADRDWRSVAAPATLLVVAVVLFAGFAWNFRRELVSVSVVGPPTFVFLLGATLSVGIGWWGVRLRRSSFTPRDQWAVALWTAGGVAALTVVVVLTLWIRLAEGRTVGEPQLPVLIGAASGGHLGALAGYYYAEARKRAAETERAREALSFLNRTIRHEVLNGVAVLRGNAERLRAGDDREEALTAIEAQSRDIGEQMRDVQEVAGLLSGATDVESVDLSDTVRSRVAVAREANPDATIDCEIEPDVVVRGAEPLSHAIDNVLGNAVEHGSTGPPSSSTPEDTAPTVRVRVVRDGDVGVLRATDDGPGIPDEDLASLFEPDEGRTHGFGLYLVRTLVEQCGGTVVARNHPDRGATFELRLPLA